VKKEQKPHGQVYYAWFVILMLSLREKIMEIDEGFGARQDTNPTKNCCIVARGPPIMRIINLSRGRPAQQTPRTRHQRRADFMLHNRRRIRIGIVEIHLIISDPTKNFSETGTEIKFHS